MNEFKLTNINKQNINKLKIAPRHKRSRIIQEATSFRW